MVFVLGKSGSGKSTFLNIISGLDEASEGEFIVNGTSSKSFSKKDYDDYRNTYVGFVLQDFGIIEELTVGQNIAFAGELQGKKVSEQEINDLLSTLDLKDFGKRKPNTLSGGQKQRVAIARALIKNPKMILADEPTGSLDSESGESVLSLLKELSKDRLVVVVSHDRAAADSFADRIIEFKDGSVLRDTARIDSFGSETQQQNAPLSFAKSHLPFLKGVKLGLSSAKHKPFRLISTLLLTAVSFSLFGILSTLVLYDDAAARRDAALKLHSTSDFFKKSVLYTEKVIEYDYIERKISRTREDFDDINDMISRAELDELNARAKTAIDFAGVYSTANYPFEVNTEDGYISPLITDKMYSCTFFSGFTDCGSAYLERNNIHLLAGEHPNGPSEIAISNYHAAIVCNDASNADKADYSSALGMTIRIPLQGAGLDEEDTLFKITGVYDSGSIDPYYSNRFEESSGRVDSDFFDMFLEYMKGSYHCLGYVSDSFYDKYGSIFKKSLSLYRPTKVSFEGVIFSDSPKKSKSSTDNGVNVFLPEFENMEAFTFHNLKGERINYSEPKRGEIFVNKNYYRERHYTKLRFELSSAINNILSAYESSLLPELEDFISTERGSKTLESVSYYLRNVDVLAFASNCENGLMLDEISSILDAYGEIAFKRLYLHTLVKEMISMNRSYDFGIADLSSSSSFYRNVASYVNLPMNAPSMDVFDECYDHILSTPSLLEFANRMLCYMNYKYGEAKDDDALFYEIKTAVESGGAKRISSYSWEELQKVFRARCEEEEYLYLALSGYTIPCAIENIVSFDNTYHAPSLSVEVPLPEKIYYRNYLGTSGALTVKGYFEVNEGPFFSDKVYFANEDFMNVVGMSPHYVNYTIIETDYEPVEETRYNFVITKTSFSLEQIREICRKGKGFEYRLQNSFMSSIDFFITLMRRLYIVFLIGALVIGAFAGLLLATFIASAIDYKRKEVGIIRCLGGKRSDIFAIFATESLLIAIVSALLSAALSFAGCQLINRYVAATMEITILYYGLPNLAIVLLLSFLFAVISTFIPIMKKSSIPPYVALRKE
ncbi:MAG: ATP-binding cassette domain-containing protein [Bacilli bacterium]|nr:ATP-binding cassette domain-containing protein [Bacilli bacterium]